MMLQSATLSMLFALVLHMVVLVSCQRVLLVNPTRASAVFNLRGITGSISFNEEQNFTSVLVNLGGLSGSISQWSIRQLPADNTLSPTDRCSQEYLGGIYDNARMVNGRVVGDLSGRFGSIRRSGVATFNDTQRAITLQGPGSVVGRALLLQVGTSFACATIRSLSQNDAVTLRATLISPVAGVIYFRQTGSEPTVIHGKLYWIDTSTASSVDWAIYDDSVTEFYRAGICGNPSQQFDDLSGRHGMLTVSSAPQPYSENGFLFTDNVLMLSGLGTIEGRTLVLRQGGNIISCAPIVMAEPLEAAQYPDFKLQISQTSPHENSTLTMSQGITSSATYSILDAAWMTNRLCPATGEIYNPLGTVQPGSNVAFRTPDMYPKGDISGILGTVTGPSQELSVTELPTYGRFTMLGLTMREVNSNGAQPYRSCSALLPLMDEFDNTVMAKATFIEGTVSGAIYFIQKQSPLSSRQPGMTNIIVDLYYNDPTAAQTTGHNWHVHVDLPQPGVECAFAVGWHFNPFDVDLGDTYSAECGIDAPLRCESGDLSGKHGRLIFSALGPNRRIETFVDPNLQLQGEYKIIGRSIGLHMSPPNTALFSCAEVKQLEMNSPKYDVVVAFPEPANFERVTFAKQLLEMASLDGTLDPSDVLVLQEQVGAVQSVDSGMTCASVLAKITASSAQEANTFASIVQKSACVNLVDNGCMGQLPDYERLCAGVSSATKIMAIPISAVLIMIGSLLYALS